MQAASSSLDKSTYQITVSLSEKYLDLSDIVSTCKKKGCQLDGTIWAWTRFTGMLNLNVNK